MLFFRLKTWFFLLWSFLLAGHVYAQPANDHLLYSFSPYYERGGGQLDEQTYTQWQSALSDRYRDASFQLTIHPLRSNEDAPLTVEVRESNNQELSIKIYVSKNDPPRLGPLLQTEAFLFLLFGYHEGNSRGHVRGTFEYFTEDHVLLRQLSQNFWSAIESRVWTLFTRVCHQDPFASILLRRFKDEVHGELDLSISNNSNYIVNLNGSRRIRRQGQSPRVWPNLALMDAKHLLPVTQSLSRQRISIELQEADILWGLENNDPVIHQTTVQYLNQDMIPYQNSDPHIGRFRDEAREQFTRILIQHYEAAALIGEVTIRSEAYDYLDVVARMGSHEGLLYLLQRGQFGLHALHTAPGESLMNAFLFMLNHAHPFGTTPQEHALSAENAQKIIEDILKIYEVTEANRGLLDTLRQRLITYINHNGNALDARGRTDRLQLIQGLALYSFKRMTDPEAEIWPRELEILLPTAQALYNFDQAQIPLRRSFVMQIFSACLNHPDARVREAIYQRLRILVRNLTHNPLEISPNYLEEALRRAQSRLHEIDCD